MIPHYVLLIHGIGDEKPGFNRGLKKNIQMRFIHALEELKNSVPSLSHERFTVDSVVVREIVWSDLTQNDQDCLWRRLYPKLPKKRFGWLELLGEPGAWIPRLRYLAFFRQFVLNYFGDPISYVPKGYQYIRIHKRLYDDFNELHKEIQSRQNDERAFVTVVAHSLGSVIASDWIYDMFNKLNGKDWPQQVCLANFFTFGSPLALYMLREGVDKNNFSSPIMMQEPEGLCRLGNHRGTMVEPLALAHWPDPLEPCAVLERRLRRGNDRPKNGAGLGAGQLPKIGAGSHAALFGVSKLDSTVLKGDS